MSTLHKRFGQWLQLKLMSTPKPGRRRPQPNKDLLLTRIILKILAQE
jgi:hypothetical protein